MKCEVKDMVMGHLCLIMGGKFMAYNGRGIYDICFVWKCVQIMLVFREAGHHMTTAFVPFELPTCGALQRGWDHSPPKARKKIRDPAGIRIRGFISLSPKKTTFMSVCFR